MNVTPLLFPTAGVLSANVTVTSSASYGSEATALLKKFACVFGQVYDALKQNIVILFLNALRNHPSS